VNYFEALLAFASKRGDYRTAALEMYRLSKRVDYPNPEDVLSPAPYTDLPRIDAKARPAHMHMYMHTDTGPSLLT
jgi:hypothetical protein